MESSATPAQLCDGFDYAGFASKFARDLMARLVEAWTASEKLQMFFDESTGFSIDGKAGPFHNARVCYDEDEGIMLALDLQPDSDIWLETRAPIGFGGGVSSYPDGWENFDGVRNIGILSKMAASMFPVDGNGVVGASFWSSGRELILQNELVERTSAFITRKYHISNVGHPDGQMILELRKKAKYSDVMAIRSAADLLRSSLGAMPSLGAEDALLKKVLYTNLLSRMPPVLYAGGDTDEGWFL
jgi:hypothetical protein